ncbi:phage terminase large subunit family protein [Paracoccus sp. MA]|uniref:phage terminase large subunit family protein n=1 Tax=Paracoccus sp. MA TaxID=2895796 RepID=UPI001E46C8F4|nr:terminase gpA endonuclease subunit [Paracoccus sp. MA]UFM66787.1 phage terminase large subunit family protein [Paracoccus sp. MA]
MTTMLDLVAPADILRRAIAAKCARAYQPPPRLTADEWADEYRIVPTESSAIPGRWKTSNFEIGRGPMRAISDPSIRAIIVMAGAQLMKTTSLETAVGYHMHLDPCPMLFYSSGQDTIDTTVTQKIDPMIVNTPELAALWGGAKALETKNERFTKGLKRFAGGFLELMTIGSTANLRNRSAKVVLVDELDDCAETVDGDPVALASSRATQFKGREKLVLVSTPTIRGKSRIELEYQKSDMRKPYIACPCCGEMDYLKWKRVKFKDAEGRIRPEIAHYECEHCEQPWAEADRIRLLTTKGAIVWRQTKPFECCGELQSPETERLWNGEGRAMCKHCGRRAVPVTRAGFWGWIGYNPGWSLEAVVRDFLDCQGDKAKLKTFVNNRLGESWEEHEDQLAEVDPTQFAARVEPAWDLLPAGALVIVAGVDVQPMGSRGNGRLECEIVAFGQGDETWSVAYHVIPGDPTEGGAWAVLDDILLKEYRTEDGRTIRAQAACIDTGGDNGGGDGSIIDAVTAFAGARTRRRIWAVKGASEATHRQPIWTASAPTIRNGAKLHLVGVQAAKDWVATCVSKTQPGPGFMHVPADRPAAWFEQVTNEKRSYSYDKSGRRKSRWKPRYDGARTEALDARVYAKAAWEGLKLAVPGIARRVQSAPAAAIPAPQPSAGGDDQPIVTGAAPAQAAPIRPRKKIVRKSSAAAKAFWGR